MKTFAIGDAVVHKHTPIVGVVMAREPKGLIRVKWESGVIERVPPKELRLASAKLV